MAFTVFKKQAPTGRPMGADPRCTVRRWGAKNTVRFTFNRPLVQQLKWLKGDHVEFAVGTGEDSGYASFRRVADGYKLSRAGANQSLCINVRHAFPGGEVSSMGCGAWVQGDVLYIKLPVSITGAAPAADRAAQRTMNSISATVAA